MKEFLTRDIMNILGVSNEYNTCPANKIVSISDWRVPPIKFIHQASPCQRLNGIDWQGQNEDTAKARIQATECHLG